MHELSNAQAPHGARAIVESANDAIIGLDLDGRIVSWNDGATALYGWSADEALGQTAEFLAPAPTAADYRRHRDATMFRGDELSMDVRRVRKDGSRIVVSLRAFPLKDDSGRIVGGGSISRDITQRRELERALRKSEERYRVLFETMAEGVVLQDAAGKVIAHNEAALRILGLTSEQLTGTSSREPQWEALREDGTVFPVADHPAVAALAGGQPVSDVVMGIRRADGRLAWLLTNARPMFDEHQSTPSGVVVTFADVTARKVDADQVRESEARFRALVDSVEAGIWISDGLKLLFVNEALCRMVGYSAPELLAMDTREIAGIVHSEDIQLAIERGSIRLQGGEVTPTLDIRARHRDGRERILELRGGVMPTGEGPRILVAVTDVTERRKAEDLRRRAEKLESLEALAGGVAHDFNNLLVAILGNASFALGALPDGDPLRQVIEEIERAGQSAAHLSRQMLDYSGKGRFFPRRSDLRELLAELGPAIRDAAGPGKVVQIRSDSDLPEVDADPRQIQQLIKSLVVNASEAIGETAGTIRVSANAMEVTAGELAATYHASALPGGRYVRLAVSDDGCGMDVQARERAFDPFFSTKFVGRGLGLSSALGIVRGHGGAIRIESAEGRGTTVEVLLPTE